MRLDLATANGSFAAPLLNLSVVFSNILPSIIPKMPKLVKTYSGMGIMVAQPRGDLGVKGGARRFPSTAA